MSKKRRTSSFRGKVNKNVDKQKRAASSYGYLMLPKEVSVFAAEPGGRAAIDIIPYEVTDEKHMDREDDIAIPGTFWYKRPFLIHRNVGVEKDAVVCLKTFSKKCPICEYRSKRIGEGADKEETDKMKTSLRNLYVVIPIGHKKYDEEIHIFDISQAMFQKLLNEELKEDEENEVFPDLEEGKTLKVRFEEKTIGTSKPFAEASRIDFDDREEAYDEAILDDVPDLDSILKEYSYKELQSMCFEMDDEDDNDDIPDDEDDEEERKPARKKKTVRKKKEVVEDEDDDDEDDQDDEDEEEAPPPKRKSTRKKKPAPAPDEDEDDDEEEEKPTKRKSRTSKSKNKCPHGHKFGVDTDDHDECDKCDVWDDCIEKKES